ncbi:MAG: NADH:flavin oxidoreductase [Hyphomonadaceae bacterium]|nr:NADH:flavin oxidoreductase [Hyphomonadaceae bacterium]
MVEQIGEMGGAAKAQPLFQPFEMPGLSLTNRIVMAPMTRSFSPAGVPGLDVAAYYRRRAEGGVGLIITEGTWVPHPSASNLPNAPCFYGEDALAGWSHVADEVHAAGGKIIPQLWHVGQIERAGAATAPNRGQRIGPSGMVGSMGAPPTAQERPSTVAEIEAVGEAYVTAAISAYRLGFDGVELHAAHGYLFDQFFWHVTNLRDDIYGGDLAARTQFAADVVRNIRANTSPTFPIVLRISQWKQQDYGAKLAETPQSLEALLAPLADAGVDIFHCSQRRFWEGEFGTDLNLAGWAKKLTGKPTITVGSVTLKQDLIASLHGAASETAKNLDQLLALFERGDFDLVAVGRALIVDPDWPIKVKAGFENELLPYSPEALQRLL